MLRIALDGTPLIGARTGVGWWTQGLFDHLARLAPGRLELIAFGVTWRGRGELAGRVPAGVRVVKRPMPARPVRMAWLRADGPPIELWTGRVDVVHGTNFLVPPGRAARGVATIHDLTAWRFPELCTRDTLEYPALVGRALQRGAWMHVNSRFVGAELADLAGADPERVVLARPGIPDVRPADPARGRELAGSERYVLALGTVEPRKDLPTLVRAFERLACEPDAADVRLVVAGPDGWGAEALRETLDGMRCARDRVVRLGYVESADRDALIHGATVFAYPSVYEGFGFPPLEAMAAGVPVVASTAGALPEVLGEAARLVTAGDVDALAGALAAVLGDEAEQERLRVLGARRVDTFSWDAFASDMVALYERMVSEG